MAKVKKFTTSELNQKFLDSLVDYVSEHSSVDEKPLVAKLKSPYNVIIKVFLYNCTNPPGARQAGECKSQIILPNQKRGERGCFQIEPGIITLLAGLASIDGDMNDAVFILWELKKHMDFAYSANVQVSLASLLRSYSEPLFSMKKRGNGETIVVARPSYLADAIQKRINIDIDLLLEE